MAPQQPLQDRRLEPVRVGVVVLLADEHDVGARKVGEHGFEVAERVPARVEHTLGDVRGIYRRRSGFGISGTRRRRRGGRGLREDPDRKQYAHPAFFARASGLSNAACVRH
jgi:hypothetical protein